MDRHTKICRHIRVLVRSLIEAVLAWTSPLLCMIEVFLERLLGETAVEFGDDGDGNDAEERQLDLCLETVPFVQPPRGFRPWFSHEKYEDIDGEYGLSALHAVFEEHAQLLRQWDFSSELYGVGYCVGIPQRLGTTLSAPTGRLMQAAICYAIQAHLASIVLEAEFNGSHISERARLFYDLERRRMRVSIPSDAYNCTQSMCGHCGGPMVTIPHSRTLVHTCGPPRDDSSSSSSSSSSSETEADYESTAG
jgi:hypothetical protein